MQVYEKVNKYITDRRIQQSIVAEKCNLPLDIFSAMLKGNRKMYAEDLRAICYALGVSPEEFIDYKKCDN